MPIEIKMPALSPTMKDGNIVKWNKKEGDQVSAGDVIAEIETDKATMEVEAVDEGVVARILRPEGSKAVRVNQVIALLLAEGEDPAAAADYKVANDDEKPAEAAAASGSAPAAGAPAAAASSAAPALAAPAPQFSFAAAPKADQGGSAGDLSSPSWNGERVKASPLAKKLAAKLGVDLARVRGTGPKGRVVREDVEDAARYGSGGGSLVRRVDQEYSTKENSGMRRVIAGRLLQSKQYVPHFYLSIDCELDALLDVRATLNEAAPKDEQGKPAYKLSVNDLVVKAAAQALKANPDANTTWTEEHTVYYSNVDISVAVAIEGGLITPIVRNADQKTPAAISAELVDLIKRARANKLAPHEFQGGGFSISNLGMFGIKQFNAIINPPQSCILAIGAGERRPVVKDDKIVPATVMSVTLSCDHRTVDGAVGAKLLQDFKRFIERPVLMLV